MCLVKNKYIQLITQQMPPVDRLSGVQRGVNAYSWESSRSLSLVKEIDFKN